MPTDMIERPSVPREDNWTVNRIHFLRACWSDIILVESGGSFALIDTGYAMDSDRILDYLDRLHVGRLKWILITHFHRDHYGGLEGLLQRIPVGTVYIKKFSGLNITDGSGRAADAAFNRAETENCENLCALAAEASSLVVIDGSVTRVRLGEFDFRLFGTTDALRDMYSDPASPYHHQIRFGENVNSVALYAEIRGTKVYLGGDANDDELADRRYSAANTRYARAVGGPVDLYKVPHHGCGNIFGDEALSILRPRVSVVTNWRPTFDRRFTANRDRLLSARPDARVLCTDRCGYVFTLGPEGMLTCEEIDRVPDISLEEVPAEGARAVLFIREGIRIGGARFVIDRETSEFLIRDFMIFPAFRGRGAGHFCFETFEKHCRAAGAKAFSVSCEKPEVIRFWKAFGFTEEGADGDLTRLRLPEL